MKRLINIICAFTLLMCTLLLSSCDGHTDRLLSTLPYHHRCVLAVINFDYIASLTDARLEDGDIEIDDPYKAFIDSLAAVREDSLLIRVGKGLLSVIDRTHVLYYRSQDGEELCTFCISDVKDADTYISQWCNGSREPFEDYCFYNFGNFYVCIRDHQGWIFSGPKRRLMALIDESKENNIGDLDGVKDYIRENKSIRILALTDYGENSDGVSSRWHCADLMAEETGAHVTLSQMLGDGTSVKYSFCEPVSTDFLRYFPDGLNVVGAFAFSERMVNTDDLDQITDIIGSDLHSAIALLRPFIESVDGTLAFGLESELPTPADTSFTPGQFVRKAIIMAHMSQNTVTSVISQIQTAATMAGLPIDCSGMSGRCVIDLTSLVGYPVKVYAADCDGYLTISTFPAEPTCQNSLAPFFQDKNSGVMISFGNISGLLRDCNYGVDLKMSATSTQIDMSLAFPGSGASFSATAIELINRIAL